MTALTRIETKTHALCPSCNGSVGTIDHLPNYSGSLYWYCDDCGRKVKITMEDGVVVGTSLTGDKVLKTLDFLRSGGIGLIVEGMVFHENGGFPDFSGKEYFYNEHTCPTNYMSKVIAVVDLSGDGPDFDPHGIFGYIGSEEWCQGAADDCNFDFSVYSEIFKKGETK